MTTIHQFVETIFPAILKSRAIKGFSFNTNDSERDNIVKKHIMEINFLNYRVLLKSRFNQFNGLNTNSLKYVFNPLQLVTLFENYDIKEQIVIESHLKEIAKLEFTEFIEGYLNQSNEEEFETFGTENILCESHIKAILDLISDQNLYILYVAKRENRFFGSIKDLGFFD